MKLNVKTIDFSVLFVVSSANLNIRDESQNDTPMCERKRYF